MLARLSPMVPCLGNQRVFPLDVQKGQKSDFFSIPLRWGFPGKMKRVVVDQFLVCGEVIGLNSEVVVIERLWAGRGTEIRAIRFSRLLRGESA